MSRRRSIAAVFAAALLIGAAGAAGAEDILGKPAYDFTLKDLDGNDVSLSDFRGKVVVLDFWAVWCGPCQVSLPFFQKMADTYGPDGLVVVGLHVDDRMPSLEEVRQYLEDRGVHYTNLVSTFEVDEAYQVFAMPTTYLVDREGRIAKRHVGFHPERAPKRIEKDIRELLGRD